MHFWICSGGQMKPVLRSKPDEEDMELFPGSPRKDWSIRLIKVVSVMVIFMAGAVLGLSVSAHFTRYFTSQTELFFPTTIYTANCDKDYLSIKNYIKPKQLKHSMTDDELFWRASMVPKKAEYPYNRVQKVAFMFLTRGALPFAPLWERFFHGHEDLFSVYLHSLPNYKLNVSDTSPFYGRQIPSQAVEWGSVSLVDAEKRLLANALLDFSNERFILLSESCIPIFDFSTVYKYLISSKHSFVESYDEPSPRGRGRYSRRMAPAILLYQWRKGSEWFEVNRELAVNIVADFKYYTIFRKYCKPSCYPDEHYIPTYLNMFHGDLNSNRSITWVDWSRGGPHPALFGRRDVTESFIQSIRNNGTICTHNFVPTSVCFLFARKFAPNALEPLLNISSTVMKY
uniref:Peroxiredoxin-5, mitochondrial n=1 Tax=Anthurium amnicola TaxID=1678845 RepID=A0A1D1Z3L2_9ARAE